MGEGRRPKAQVCFLNKNLGTTPEYPTHPRFLHVLGLGLGSQFGLGLG